MINTVQSYYMYTFIEGDVLTKMSRLLRNSDNLAAELKPDRDVILAI